MSHRRLSLRALLPLLVVLASMPAAADITNASLEIQGIGLSLVAQDPPVTTGIDVPTTVQTKFGGKENDQALTIEGLRAVGDLTGPGLDAPLELSTAPGHKFQIPGLSREGVYTLQNVRLMKGSELLQYATPSAVDIIVADLFKTTVEVRQLTPDEIRERGIVIDARNFEVYEYTLSFLLRGDTIKIPFPVIIDPRTRQVQLMPVISPYTLPPIGTIGVGRWTPPEVIPVAFEDEPLPEEERNSPKEPKEPGEKLYVRPPIPAAIVIPNSLAVMHQFFVVQLSLQNGAPNGSTARLENLSARIRVPSQLRTATSKPAVALGQAVPLVDKVNGLTVLVAQAKAEAEWSVEALKPGTHTIEIELRGTLKENGQEDVPMVARPRASVVVHDARFNIAFSHPEVVRKGIEYTTYSFITNTSPAQQTIILSNSVPPCSTAPIANVCRVDGGVSTERTIPSGETATVEYKLRSGVTGKVFATAAHIDSEVAQATAQLHMGVSDTGIPLSPTTLIMPHYAQYVSPSLVGESMQILGLGYSLATAPVTSATAKQPRVIKSDVYRRAVDIAQAGQHIFLANDAPGSKADAIAALSVDLLGNLVNLSEWDALRRQQKYARPAGAAVTRELEATAFPNGTTYATFIDNFGKALSHRDGYVAALVHGPKVAGNARPYALSVRGMTSNRRMDIPAEAESGWVRDLPYGELTRISAPGADREGELALVGRWTDEDLEVIVTPSVDGMFDIELLYPNTTDGSTMRAHVNINGTAGIPVRVPLSRGATTINALTPSGGFADSETATAVALETLRVIGMRQDLYLDPYGHKVSVLFNRPVAAGTTAANLRTKFHGEIDFNKDGVVWMDEPRPISGAALQESGRVIDLTFDHVLTTNADYTIEIDPLADPRTSLPAPFAGEFVPKIDNDRPAGIIYGRFIRGDNTPLGNHEVILFGGIPNPFTYGAIFEEFENPKRRLPVNPFFDPPQIVNTRADGSYLFEFVRRDMEAGYSGEFRLWGTADNLTKYTYVNGMVRLPGRVHTVSLQLLGRGSAEGTVRYDNGQIAKKVNVTVGSTAFEGVRTATTDDNGFYRVEDLPVGPLAFTATDGSGNIGYAAGEIAVPGEIEQQDISIFREPTPKNGSVHGTIRRSDTGGPVMGASVGIFHNGYPLQTLTTDSDGRYTAEKVPAGFISVVAAEWTVSRQSANTDFDLRGDESRQIDLTLSVAANEQLATVTGEVLREDPLFPGNPSKYQRVPGALVKIDMMRIVTADAEGRFVIPDVPLTPGGRNIGAHDPSTRRTERVPLPALTGGGTAHVPILLKGLGQGTIRVKLFDARGLPAPGFEMLVKAGGAYFAMDEVGGGVYELDKMGVGGDYIVRTGTPPEEFGDQEVVSPVVRVAFDGQIVSVSLRLPGQGEVRVNVKGISLPSDGGQPILTPLISDVSLTYSVFNSATLQKEPKEILGTTNQNGLPGEAIFPGVPALREYSVSSNHPLGSSGASGRLAFDADLGSHTLTLSNLGHIMGTVYAIDGVTPVPGATIRMDDEHQDQGVVTTGLDGKFEFRNVAPGSRIHLVAESTQAGVYRTGERWTSTPGNGGIVNASVTLLERGQIEGKIVYGAYKVYDPLHPENNVPDNTPSDLSDNAPVPMARFWMRELDFPRRDIGTGVQPLNADLAGRFAVGNVFIGRLRATAWDPSNPDLRGDWTGTMVREGELLTPYIAIGGGGTGAILAKVTNPNQNNAPVENAEVQLFRGGLFDIASSGPDGTVRFEQLPVGTYVVSAYSKALGKSGRAPDNVIVTTDTVTEARVMLTFSGQVTGRLTDPESTPEPNKPVQGSHVTISMAEGFQQRFTTTALGEYLFEGVREGLFTLDAKDTASNRRAKASYLLTAADPEPVVNLELERTETLHLAVYLPDDLGANSGVLAGPVEATVKQRFGEFHRAQQGNPIVMSKLFLNESYEVDIQELGGDRRQLGTAGRFPKGSATQPISLVYPAYGSGEVLVRRLGAAVADARVSIRVSKYDTRVFYSDAAGRIFVSGLPLGKNYSVTVTTLDGSSGSGNLEIIRTSVTGSLTVEVGSRATVTGKVLAEKGGPSVGTPVVINFSGGQLTATTDHEGSFTFAGVAAPSGIELRYYGEDGSTLGRLYTFSLGAQWAGQVYTVPTVTLDATPPLLLDISPAQGAGTVPPDTHLKFVFSEKINTSTVNNDTFFLQPADGSPRVNASFSFADGTNGTFIVTMVPPAPPAGQQFPLKSNTLYRLTVSQHVRDLTGHPLGTDRGLTFTTADYVEPRVISTVPAAGSPIPEQITYEFRFNEPLDPAPFAAGGAGRVQLDRMSGPEENATVVENIPGDAYIDPFTGISLFFAPSIPTVANSFYRIKFSGVRDLQGNIVPEQTYRLVSFDTFKPFVILPSPVPGDASLVSGLTYKLTPDIRNGDANGAPAIDIDFVDYFRVENGVDTFIKRVRKTPFAYDFVAPDSTPAGLTLVFRASATDLSVNESTKTELSLTVKPNQPPVVSVALDRTTDVYAGERVNATLTATDEVLTINVQLDVKGTRTDNTEYRKLESATLQRAKISDPWPTKTFAVDLPVNLKGGTPVNFIGIATDMSGLSASSTTPVTLTVDTVKPVIVSMTPADRAQFAFHTSYQVSANVTDVGTGVANVVFNVDGTLYTVQKAAAVGTTFTSPSIPVVAHSVDTIVPITVTATDNSGNSFSQSFEVVYLAVTDLGLPVGEWLCPISGAMLPANTNTYPLKLRFRAVDETSVNSVRFRLPGVEELVVPTSDAPNEYAATVTINTPAADAPEYIITAIVDDGDPEHTQEFRLRLSFVVPDLTVDSTQAITSSNLSTYEDKTIVVTGVEGRLVPHVPVRFKNLLVLNGARIETLPTTTSTERKLDMTVTGTLSVDCASTINVTGLGYLGANVLNADGSGTRNDGEVGRTFGNSTTGGAKSAGASHGGVGVLYNVGATNAVYGSYTEPRTLGAGGGSNSNSTAANGGGAVAISGSETSRFIIAGSIRADGKDGAPLQGAGAGGSVLLQSADIAISRSGRVTANGGGGIPGGGGRVALHVTRSLAMPDDTVQARGGYNAHGEGFGVADGGAGTLYIVRPGANAGETESELRISGFNEQHPDSSHQLLPTPLGTVNGPELLFGSIFVGPRAMLRFDSLYQVTKTDGQNVDPAGFLFGPSVQPTVSFTSNPPIGASVYQNAQIVLTYDASSADGVGQVFISLPGRTDQVESFGPYPPSVGPRNITITIPSNAAIGPIAAKVRVLSRSLRSAEQTATYTVVSDAAPQVQFDSVVPSTELYAGGTIAVNGSATDDLEVKSLNLSASTGSVNAQTATKPTPQSMARQFSVTLPKTAASGTAVLLTLSASDGFPGRPAATATHTVTVKPDTIKPAVSIVKPTPNQEFGETANATFTIEVQATDDEVGVNTVKATFEGTTYTLNPVPGLPGRYSIGGVPIPQVDGTDPVAKTVSVSVTDYQPNTTDATTTIYIRPLVDENAPKLAWICSSPNAMYPAGYAVPLRVSASRPDNIQGPFAVQRVEYTVNGGAITPMPGAGVTDEYAATFTIPAGTAAGTVFNVRVAAFSSSNNEATLLGTLTVVAGNEITTARDVSATDLAFDNSTVIVRSGGVLTVTGPHTFTNLVVLSGGKFVQKHLDLARADQLTVDRFYLACGANVDVNRLGHANNVQAPGVGWGDDWDGGSHIGSGSIVIRAAGGAFGSVYRPAEMGGSGHHLTSAISTVPGGGAFRLAATGSIVVDGTIQALSGNITDGSGGVGAGGSVWLSTPGTLAGAGSIDASGGNVIWHGAGGGGAIALEYASASGRLLSSLKAYGGSASGSGRPAAAGSIYKRGAASTYGDLTIAANTTNLYSASFLPAFGRRIAATASGSNATLAGAHWLPASMAGHWLRVIAPDGTTRGTWRISSVTNHASARTWTTPVDLKLQDGVAYDGYIVYSHAGLGAEKRRWAGARFSGGTWQYDNDSAFVTFTPAAGDVIVASFSKDATRVTDVRKTVCCTTIDGIPVIEMTGGEFVPNAVASTSASASPDPAEIFIRSDGRNRGIILSGGSPTIAFEGTPEIQPGDVLQGVYRFDNISLTNARVITDDLVEGQVTKDAASTIASGNAAAPSFAPSSFSFTRGLDGPVLVAPAGSAVDTDGVDAVARVATATPSPTPLDNPRCVVFELDAGLTIRRVVNGRTTADGLYGDYCGASATRFLGSNGAVAFSAAQTNKEVQASLVATTTTRTYNAANHNSFVLKSNGTYEVWANAVNANKNAAYTAATVFRIEKAGSTLRWYVDGVRVHESAANVPATARFDVSFNSDSGALRGIEIAASSPDLPSYQGTVAADGSFRVPLRARAGDAILVKARDRHRNPIESSEVAAVTIPADFVITSVAFAPSEVTGGRTSTGTVTLPAPAGTDGVRIDLSSSSSLVTVPASFTIAAGQTSGTFTATTTAVTGPIDATIVASWGAATQTGALRVVKDNIFPTVAVTLPVANTQYNEGSGKIQVQANVTDADSGVKRVFATFNGGTYEMPKNTSKGPNAYFVEITAPFIEGAENQPFDVVVSATDNNDNLTAAPAVTVIVKPLTDTVAPILEWRCSSTSAMYPVGYAARLRVYAKIADPSKPALQSVQFTVTDPSGTPTTFNAASIGNDLFEYVYTVPDVADRSVFTISARAITGGGGEATVNGSFSAIKGGVELKANATIAANDLAHDGKALVIWEGVTVTIDGLHTYDRLVVLFNGKLQSNGMKFEVNPTSMYVACGGSVDMTGKGYATGTSSYPGETTQSNSITGASHIGRGGLYNGTYGSTYGSIYRPLEAGASANNVAGGGVVRINAGTISVDGAIRANGASKTSTDPSGSGGSVWITSTRISGIGTIETNGGSAYHGIGGGGAVAVEYTDPASTLPVLISRTGTQTGESRYGGAGSVYVKGASSTYGDLTIDNQGLSNQPTILPSFGKGTAQTGTAGATLVTNRTKDIPAYFAGHWVEIYAPDGALKGTWRIAAVNAVKTVTLAPNGSETINLAVGDTWQGVYRFDNMKAVGIRVESPDPIRIAGTQTIEGTVEVEQVTATKVVVKGTLTHAANQSLVINADEVHVETGGAIDATGKGYTSGTSTYPGETTQSNSITGASHIGRGGLYNGTYGSTYGSIYRPLEAGASANNVAGGGVVRINAAKVIVDGAIRANGASKTSTDPSGAGGSVWITTGRISGSGAIETNGGNAYHGIGGGGAISVEYTDPASTLPTLTSRTGNQTGESRYGGAGSIYVKGASSTYGDLTIDNKGLSNQPTILPSFGKGIAQAGTAGATLVTNRTANIPAYFLGHWVEIYAPDGTPKGTWRIATIDAVKTVTLAPNGSETVTLAAGDTWQGVYRFDNVTTVGIRVESPDPIRVSGTQTIEGTVETERITATTLVVKGTLTHTANQSLVIDADEVRVETGATIDASGKGFTGGYTTYPGETQAGSLTGASHIGRGGLYNSPFGTTYGSIYRPQEAGGAANGIAGGGVVRIDAARVIVNGIIRANGATTSNTQPSGSGGSVWITTDRITGSGSIETNGGAAYHGIGGGGAISVEYTDPISVLPTLTSRTGTNTGENRPGGAGSIYVKGPSSTYGDLTIDNKGLSNQPTILPSFGKGLAQTGTGGATLVTNRAANIPAYFIGHWVEIYAPDGTLKGTWRIASIDAVKTVTLAPNGSESIDLAAGDTWQGVYRFDNMKSVGIRVESPDPIRVGGTQTIEGTVETEQITTGTLVVKGTLTHAANQRLVITADEVHIQSTGVIDATGKGYTSGYSAYPGETVPGSLTGASHIGRGGLYNSPYGSTYGSIYRPQEAGGAANGIAGGGVVRIDAATVIVDGIIRANGATTSNTQPSGSGGSVWITAGRISGNGTIETDGGRAYHGIGGGGAISIEFTDPASTLPTLKSRTGVDGGENRPGGAGSVYVKGANSTYGDLTINNDGRSSQPTILPSFGKGLAQAGTAGATLVTNRSKDIPAYFVGHWVEIYAPDGTLKGTWRIASIDTVKTVTLAPNGSETANVAAGDTWQGVYRFDNLKETGIRVESPDPIRVSVTQTIEGTVETEQITAATVVVKGTLTHAAGLSLGIQADEVRIEAGAAIDVTAKGFTGGYTTYPGETAAGSLTGASHIGRGGLYNSPFGTTYGSIYRPQEAGGAANGIAGGGVVRIDAARVIVDGAIRANGGTTTNTQPGGAGGSVWISADRISGSGTISTDGGRAYHGIGGGGAISVEFTDPASTLPTFSSRTGTNAGENRNGGAGSIYVLGSSATYGNLTIDNKGVNGEATVLPSLGTGGAQAGTSGATVVTSRTANIPVYFLGHWVEIKSAAGTVKGTWRIGAINGKTMTLTPNASEAIDVQPGDAYQGVYRFDNVTLRTSRVVSGDPIVSTSAIDQGSTVVEINDGAPTFPVAKRSQIVVESAVAGDAVTGPVGAVLDSSLPIKLLVTNTRTSATYPVTNANSDGSFRVPVTGAAGDAFTIIATDSHSLPLSSVPVPVNGVIVETNSIASFTIQPSTVTGGTTVYGSVRLASPARSTGAVVSLSSSAPGLASVPATFTIAGGTVSAQFAIATSTPATTTEAQITASIGTSSATAPVTVTAAAAALADLVLTSSSVEGGTSVNGTVVLGAPAPPGGALILLASNAPQAGVPSTVVVPEGSTEAPFTVTTSKVGADMSATISATWGDTRTADLALTKCQSMTAAAPLSSAALNTVWFDDAAPAGAAASGDAAFDNTQIATGTMALHFQAATTLRTWTFTNGAPLSVAPGDRLVLHALVNPCNPPRQILVQWSDGTTQYRASWGQNRITNTLSTLNAGSVPAGGVWQRLEVIAKTLPAFPAAASKTMTGLTISVDGGEAWIDAAGVASCSVAKAEKPSYLPNEKVWFDDAAPTGATLNTTYNWDTAQVASGNSADLVGTPADTATVQHYFTNAPNGPVLKVDDMLLVYVFLDPCNPPRELMLQFSDTATGYNRRAYWGDNLIEFGSYYTVQRRRMGALPETGKWVRLEVPVAGMQMTGMTLNGVAFTLYGGRAWFDRVATVSRVNLALNKPASQSSGIADPCETYNCPSKAVDGDLLNYQHTEQQAQAYWQVDLGAVQPIDTIDVWNGGLNLCCQERMQNFWVFVSNKEFESETVAGTLAQSGVTAYYFKPQGHRPTTYEVRRSGRHVRVQLAGTNYLHIAEVQVWAPLAPEPVNLAVGRKASQSSTFQNTFLAAMAVNGGSIGETESHTNSELEAWWQVDLGSIQSISTVDLDNVYGNNEWQRMGNFWLFVSDSEFPLSNKVSDTLAQSGVSAYYRIGPNQAYKFDVNRTGRFVRIQLTGTNFLHPMEVRVWSPTLNLSALAKTPAKF